MFENTLRFVTEADLTYLHVFPFPPREGTPAARMPQISRRTAKERAARLRALGDTQFAKLCASRIGRTENILVERDGLGRTEQFIPVAVERARPGDIVTAKIDGTSTDGLIARRDKVAA